MQRGKASGWRELVLGGNPDTTPFPAPRPSWGHSKVTAGRRLAESKRPFHAMSSSTGGAPMTGCATLDFTIPVTFGATGTTFDLLFDTGSSTLAVAGSGCSSCTSAGVTKLYGNTGTNTGKTASSSYGDNSGWSANIYTDTVTIHGATGTVTPAVSMNIASMTSQTGGFFYVSSCTSNSPTTSPTEGIIGFGYETLAEANTDSFMYKYAQANPTLSNSFYVEMCLLDGALWMSGMSLSTYKGQFYYVPIKTQTYFVVDVSNVLVNGVSRGAAGSGEWIVDSGSSLWSLPTAIYSTIVSALDVNLGTYFNLGRQDVSRTANRMPL